MRRPLVICCVVVLAGGLAACSSGSSGSDDITPSPSTTSSPAPTSSLPDARDIGTIAGSSKLAVDPEPDWAVAAGGDVWVAGADPGVARFDATTGRANGGLALRDVCLGMDQGFGSLWVVSCTIGKTRLSRVDLKTGRSVASIAFPSAPAESSVGAGEGGVWLLTGQGNDTQIVRVDPGSNQVVLTRQAPRNAAAVRAGLGGVWVSTSSPGALVRLDPGTGRTVATIPVGLGARFLALGAGAVWVMNQSAGTVSRVDPLTNTVAATIRVSTLSIDGGDIAASDQAVWVRVGEVLAAKIDPATNQVVERLGPASGSGSIAIGSGTVWITAHDVQSVWRVPQP